MRDDTETHERTRVELLHRIVSSVTIWTVYALIGVAAFPWSPAINHSLETQILEVVWVASGVLITPVLMEWIFIVKHDLEDGEYEYNSILNEFGVVGRAVRKRIE